LETVGLKEVLALRLFQYVRDHLQEFLEFPPEPEVMGYVSKSHLILSWDIVRKWGLKFAPDDSLHIFLERLSELELAYEVIDDAMLHVVPELLKGQV
jgi:hypothetical protein